MPLFRDNKKTILFVHIPKTGGTAIESLLSSYSEMSFYSRVVPTSLKVCPQHLLIRDLKVLLGNNYWDWAFSVVRDPYDKLESEFCFRNDIGDQRYGQHLDFSTWLIKSLHRVAKNSTFWDNHFRPQTDFLDSNVTIFRYEEGIENAVAEASKFLGIVTQQALERKNPSKRQQVDWSLDALNLVNDFYSNDFKQLGYRKRRKRLLFFGSK